MALLFLAFLAGLYLLHGGRKRTAMIVVAMMWAAMLGVLLWEATTPLDLVF